MNTKRRTFLSLSLAAAAGSLLAADRARAVTRAIATSRPGEPRSILILGGTGFLGPACVAAARARGHRITIFNRGRTEKFRGLPDGVEHLYGNRDPKLTSDEKDPQSPKGLTQLEGKTFDAVIDTSGYVPRIVKASAELLAPSVKQYVFISSVSVYADRAKPGADTSAPLAQIDDPTVESMGAKFENYGPLKALCEQAAEAAMPGRVTNLRPGLIVGPGDPTDRFTYWPVRISEAKSERAEVLCPGEATDPIQVIDVRDLAEWIVRLIESNTTGTFDALGPQTGLTMGGIIDACKTASANADARLTWADASFLEEQQVSAWGDMPVWVPPVGDGAGMHQRNIATALAAGVTFRPILDTVRDTLAWWPGELDRRARVTRQILDEAEKSGSPKPKVADPRRLKAGITPERESEVLAAWHKSHEGKS